MSVRVALVDDHQPFRERLRALLQRDRHVEIVAEASSGDQLLELAGTTALDVVCMDIRLPGMSGVEATRRLLARYPRVRVLGLSAYAEPHYVEAMLDAGAAGHFTKGDVGEALLRAIHDASAASPRFGANIMGHAAADAGQASPPAAPATEAPALGARERAVLAAIARGLNADAIARELDIEAALVEVYRRNLLRKLELPDADALERYARRSPADRGGAAR